MRDQVIRLKDGEEYYVLDEMIENQIIYLFLVQVNNATETVSNSYVTCELKFKDKSIVVDKIEDKDVEYAISKKFVERMCK